MAVTDSWLRDEILMCHAITNLGDEPKAFVEAVELALDLV